MHHGIRIGRSQGFRGGGRLGFLRVHSGFKPFCLKPDASLHNTFPRAKRTHCGTAFAHREAMPSLFTYLELGYRLFGRALFMRGFATDMKKSSTLAGVDIPDGGFTEASVNPRMHFRARPRSALLASSPKWTLILSLFGQRRVLYQRQQRRRSYRLPWHCSRALTCARIQRRP